MKLLLWFACFVICVAPAPVRADETLTEPFVLELSAPIGEPPMIQAEINGQPVTLVVAPDGPGLVLLNSEAALRLGLRSNPILSLGIRLDVLGSVTRGKTGRASVAIEGMPRFRERIVWFEERAVSDRADGIVGLPALAGLTRVIVTIEDPERPPDRAMNVVRFDGERGFEWTFNAPGQTREFDIALSFLERSQLTRATQRALQGRGMVGPAEPALVFEQFWFFDKALAFVHPNLAVRFNGIGPDAFVRFALAEEVEAHEARLDYEQRYGSIEQITVLGSTDAELDAYQLTLGHDVLWRCWRLEFDYLADAVTLRCPDRTTAPAE